jgi:hypothetical protein
MLDLAETPLSNYGAAIADTDVVGLLSRVIAP